MKIGDHPDCTPPDTGQTTQRSLHAGHGTGPTSPAASTDHVTLSAAALQIAAEQNDAKHMPAFDTRRVSEIRQAIADGSYTTDPARIAARLWQQTR